MPCGILLLLIFPLFNLRESYSLKKKREGGRKGGNSKLIRAEQVFRYRGKLESVEIAKVHLCNISFSHNLLVINGEKATLETPTFSQKRQRTLDMLIRSLYQDMMPDLHKVNVSQKFLHPSHVLSYSNY